MPEVSFSFFYNHAIGATEPHIDDAMDVVDLILRGATRSTRAPAVAAAGSR